MESSSLGKNREFLPLDLPSYTEATSSKSVSLSLPASLADVRTTRITALINNTIIPSFQALTMSGLSRRTFLLIPSDAAYTISSHSEIPSLSLEDADHVEIIRLSGPENSLGFWQQRAVVQDLQTMLRAQLGVSGERVTNRKVASQSSPAIKQNKGSWWGRKSKRPSYTEQNTADEVEDVEEVQLGEIKVDVALEEMVLRVENEMGLYETQPGKAVAIPVNLPTKHDDQGQGESPLCDWYLKGALTMSVLIPGSQTIRKNLTPTTVQFYEFLGLKLINKMPQPEAKFDLYFLAYDTPSSPSAWTSRSGVLELTHNYGTENDPNYQVVNGNTEPYRGFGHVCISVDNIQAACKRISDAGYKFQKRLEDGRMRNIAFALDPDGYWVEIISTKNYEKITSLESTDLSTYRFNHSMLRVKDATASLKFYQEIMGMTLLRTKENAAAGFNLYFLGYPAGRPIPKDEEEGVNPIAEWEGLLELTWNYGTEKDPGFAYHNGNAEPQGFGHICVSVDDLDAACARFESLNASWKKRLTDGRMRNVAFLLDPDGYWIEIIQNDGFKSSNL
ncbi:MAG: Lactoylglutathione lyase [Cirrosporium novae-zelandiae]|nr:MAG: Lactoylglutathione lyase [Cirrosporium novae-zelandiae]